MYHLRRIRASVDLRPDRTPNDERWAPLTSMSFILASSLGLWLVIGVTLRAVF